MMLLTALPEIADDEDTDIGFSNIDSFHTRRENPRTRGAELEPSPRVQKSDRCPMRPLLAAGVLELCLPLPKGSLVESEFGSRAPPHFKPMNSSAASSSADASRN